jgi:hypothetical protein
MRHPVAPALTSRPLPLRQRSRGPLLSVLMALALLALPVPPAGAAADELVLEQQLSDVPPVLFGGFGARTDLDGDRLVVATTTEFKPGDMDKVRYYRRSGTSWELRRTLTMPDWVSDLRLSGETLAVALPYADGNAGEVRLYAVDQPATPAVVIPNPLPIAASTSTGFARALALDGDRLLVGVDASPGYVLAYERSGPTWRQAPGGVLAPPGTRAGWFPATDLDLSGDLAVVPDGFAARVYRRGAGGWALEDTVPSPTGGQLGIGSGALVAGDTVFLTLREGGSGTSVRTYRRAASGRWQLSQQLAVPDGVLEMAVDGSQLAVLARGHVELWRKPAARWVKGPTSAVAGSAEATSGDAWEVAVSGPRIALANPDARPGDIYGAGQVTVLRQGGSATRPPAAPTALRVTASRTTGTASVSWGAAGGGPVTSYVVQATSTLSGAESARRDVPASARSLTLTGLRELAGYRFSVYARGPGGDGPPARSGVVTLGGPAAVGSPFVLRDPADDHADPRQDVRSLRVEATGATVTLTLRPAEPADPYTDPVFRAPGPAARFLVRWRTPADRQSVFQHVSTNAGRTLPGEDFTFRFTVPQPCTGSTFAARLVDGAYRVSVPSRCYSYSRAIRFQAQSTIAPADQTGWSPPVRRLGSKGKVDLSAVRVSSQTIRSAADGTYQVALTARHPTGITGATIRTFSVATGQAPVRVSTTTCTKRSRTVSVCRASFRARPGELRDADAGTWRVFAQVRAGSGSLAVKESVARFSLRRSTALRATVAVAGTRLRVRGELAFASWDRRADVRRADRPVVLEFRRRGSAAWTTVARLRTSATGVVTADVADRGRGTWRLRFGSTSTYAGSTASSQR